MYDPETKIALTAVRQAAILCEAVRQQHQSTAYQKSDASPVTIADFGAQALICRALADQFPGDPVIAEEDAGMLRQPQNRDRLSALTHQVQEIFSTATEQEVLEWIDHGSGSIAPRYWTLDPIDGTKGYIRGDQYAIALALVEDGQLKLGILACPALPMNLEDPEGETGVLFLAKRGKGCRMLPLNGEQPQRLAVNFRRKEVQAVESVEPAHSDQTQQQKIKQQLGIVRSPLRIDSQAKYGIVARGEADFYIRIPHHGNTLQRRENIWDHAAGTIIVEEAGGCVTDLEGKSLDFSVGAKLIRNHGILASNGGIHKRILDIMNG